MGKLQKFAKAILRQAIPERYIVWKFKSLEGQATFTFDDGPNPEFTRPALDALDAGGVKGTFFLKGSNARQYPALVREIVDRGHEIANHSMSHQPLVKLDQAGLAREISDAGKLLSDLSGREVRLFRPPWGRLDPASLLFAIKQKLQIVMWSMNSMDYLRNSTRVIEEAVAEYSFNRGEILLFHDDNEYTIKTLPRIIDSLDSRGVRFFSLRN